MREYIVSGVPLRDPLNEWFLDYGRSSMTTENSRMVTGDPPFGYHGDSVYREGFFGTGRETLVLNVTGTDEEDYLQNQRGFLGLFNRPECDIVSAPHRSALSGGSARFAQGFSVSTDLQRQGLWRMVGSVGVERIDAAAARLTMILENRLAFWQSVNQYTLGSVPITSTTQGVPLKNITTDSTAPIVDGLIKIKGPLALNGTMLIRDGASNRSVKYTATVALTATQYVVIDMATLTARLQTSDVWTMTTGTDVSSRLDVSGDGPMTLAPGAIVGFPGTVFSYLANVTSVGHTASSTAVDFRLRRSYLS